MPREPLRVVYEHSTPEDLVGNIYDGMADLLGDDILSSDYDPALGQEWPGVNMAALPAEWEALMRDRAAPPAEDEAK